MNQNIDNQDLNKIIEELYNTNYFKNISTSFTDNTLKITVEENPIIGKLILKVLKQSLRYYKDEFAVKTKIFL